MNLSLSNDMLAISIQEDAKTFYYLQNLADKNFQKKIGRKNKVIIFKDDKELIQRRYFLKLLSKIFLRQTGDADKAVIIENALDKSIKLSLFKSNQLLQKMDINVAIEDNYAIIFSLGTHQPLFTSYLKNYFKDHLVRIRPRNATFIVYPNGEITAQLLNKLLLQKELFGSFVQFNYDNKSLNAYTASLISRKIRRSHHSALFSLLESYFGVLGCQAEDSFDVIRHHYLQLVKKYHPDTCNACDENLHVKYKTKFQEIQNAYEMLKIHFREQEALSA